MRLEASCGQMPGSSSGPGQDFGMYPSETKTGEDMIVFTFFFLSWAIIDVQYYMSLKCTTIDLLHLYITL